MDSLDWSLFNVKLFYRWILFIKIYNVVNDNLRVFSSKLLSLSFVYFAKLAVCLFTVYIYYCLYYCLYL